MEASAGGSRCIIVRLDDVGLCADATLGALELLECGIARNVSVMVPPCLDADDAGVAALRTLRGWVAEREGIAVGLHVTLNCEWPGMRWRPVAGATAVPSLVDDAGYLPPLPDAFRQRNVDRDEVARELEAQLSWLERFGFEVSYVDEHMGVGWAHPHIRESVKRFAAGHQLTLADDLPRATEECRDAIAAASRLGAAGGVSLAAALQSLDPSVPAPLLILHPMRARDLSGGLVSNTVPTEHARQRHAELRAWTSAHVINVLDAGPAASGAIRSVAIARRGCNGGASAPSITPAP